MRIVAKGNLRAFWEANPPAEQPLKAWIAEASAANWTTSAEVKAQYRNASFLGDRRVVFNIKGNDYRLIVAIAYRYQAIYIKFIGTHEDYDRIDASTVTME